LATVVHQAHKGVAEIVCRALDDLVFHPVRLTVAVSSRGEHRERRPAALRGLEGSFADFWESERCNRAHDNRCHTQDNSPSPSRVEDWRATFYADWHATSHDPIDANGDDGQAPKLMPSYVHTLPSNLICLEPRNTVNAASGA